MLLPGFLGRGSRIKMKYYLRCPVALLLWKQVSKCSFVSILLLMRFKLNLVLKKSVNKIGKFIKMIIKLLLI